MRILLSSVTIILFLFSPVVSAFETIELGQEKIAIIKATCVSTQVTLQQIKYNDAANRVNRGQSYESLMSRLILPMNSRAAVNGFSGSAASLASITTHYQQSLSNFKKHYEDYDDALVATLRTKCQNKPADFYRHLLEARKHRASLSSDISELAGLIEDYHQAVIKLRSEVQ